MSASSWASAGAAEHPRPLAKLGVGHPLIHGRWRWTPTVAATSFHAMPPPLSRRLLTAVLVAASVIAIVTASAAPQWRPVHYVAKPLATVAILLLAFVAASPLSARYRQAILGGLTCSLVGDILLMLPGDHFVPGLIAFLIAHLCYIAGFLSRSRLASRPIAFIGYGMVSSALMLSLLPSLPAALRIPVVVYVAVITAMAAQATVWLLEGGGEPARWAAIGGAWFVVSDATLAIDRFRVDVPYRSVIVLGTYFVAQWCLARSVSRDSVIRI